MAEVGSAEYWHERFSACLAMLENTQRQNAELHSAISAATARAEAAEAKVRDVETLDEWATRENYVRYGTNYDGQGLCVLVRGLKGDKMFYAVTLDAARAAAAQWVRENSPPQKKPTDEGGRGEGSDG